ncbi:DUF5010 domain-containing protein [Botrimarina sp.]|uniref:DUF5010 domain-containing protein n=1 Tax=Botrimarina sp. TaxID=2795802 RepID=UPI0032EEBDCD
MRSWSNRGVGEKRRELARRGGEVVVGRPHRLFSAGRLLVWGALAAAAQTLVGVSAHAALFQHLDASQPGSFLTTGGGATWLDVSGNNRHAVSASAGAGSVALSTDPSIFPTGWASVRFDGSDAANFGRLELLSAQASDGVLDQSGPSAAGFSLFVVARSDASSPNNTWNDLIGNTTDVADGAFLMRYNEGGGRFQAAVGGSTVQNNLSGQANYGLGAPSIYAFKYDPASPAGEITLASSLNDYSQVFNLSDSVRDRDFSNNDPLTLGKAFDTASRLFVGNVGEVKLYDAALPPAAFLSEMRALEAKWLASPDGRLDLIVDRATGLVTLHSPGAVGVSLAGLSLKSASGSLDPSDWLSITDAYDADSGSPTVDPDNPWIEFRSETDQLAEGTLGAAVLAPGQSVDLGAAFEIGGATDLTATYADPVTETTRDVLVRYVNSPPEGLLPGDYNADGSVDAADYSVWRDLQGLNIPMPNEVVSIGRVTAEDYAAWAGGFGASALATSIAAPEPLSAVLVFVAASSALACARTTRFAGRKGPIAAVAAATILGLSASAGQAATTVGAYYYPWWDTHDWNDTLRARMLPEDHRPLAGYTDSSDSGLIAEHINQSHRGNISMWSHSWWGPGSIEDRTLRDYILPHPRAGELKHSILYEPVGRLGNNSSPDFSNLKPDLEYLAEHVFSDPNYYRIDGRPVLFIWISRVYFETAEGMQALADARQSIVEKHGYDPYVVGDEVTPNFNASRAAQYDAVTRYGVYGLAGLNRDGVDPSDIGLAGDAFAAAAATGATVIPGVVPGYNDKAVRAGNAPAQRYYDNQTIDDAGSVFRDLLRGAAVPNTDAASNNLLMVTSFNEWHEDTQIEATVIAPPSTLDDSPSGADLTTGLAYEGYGYKYLDILRQETTNGPMLVDGDADFDGDLDADDVLAFAAAWGSENLIDGVRVGGYASRVARPDFNYDGVVDFADWFVMRRAHPTVTNATLSALLEVPEPSGLVLACLAIFMDRSAPQHFRQRAS